VCASGSCGACGGPGAPCCIPGSTAYRFCSAPNTMCTLGGGSYVCQSCGAPGQPTCPNPGL
jgi:hypothetical protein